MRLQREESALGCGCATGLLRARRSAGVGVASFMLHRRYFGQVGVIVFIRGRERENALWEVCVVVLRMLHTHRQQGTDAVMCDPVLPVCTRVEQREGVLV